MMAAGIVLFLICALWLRFRELQFKTGWEPGACAVAMVISLALMAGSVVVLAWRAMP
jgi:hypothetical protein